MKKIFIINLLLAVIFTNNPSFAKDERVGTTFSQVQCEYLDIDWQKTYEEVISMGFDIVRLGSYWDRIETDKDKFDFSELDWQIMQAEKNNIPVLLTVGMKAPRWPEYFIPEWVMRKIDMRSGAAVSDREFVRERVFIFITKVIERYRDKDIIVAWQVENEPLSRSGPQDLWIRKSFLEKEIALIKELDDKGRPIVINAMTYPNGFLRFLTSFAYSKNPIDETIDIAEIPAINVYFSIGHKLLGQKLCFWTKPHERMKYLTNFIDRASSQDKTIWVTELQAEPWEPGELVHIGRENPVTCGAERYLDSFKELHSLGIRTIFLWGCEYWIFRRDKYRDDAWINTAKVIIRSNR